jgi:hypothetical protein
MSDPIPSTSDLGTYLSIPTIDTPRATLILDSAVALCQTIVTPLPVGASAVVLDVAARAWANPTNATSEGAAPFSVNWGAVSGGLWLTKQNKAALRRLAGLGGAFTFDPTPSDAGSGLQPWDQNTTWLNGVPLAEDYSPDAS